MRILKGGRAVDSLIDQLDRMSNLRVTRREGDVFEITVATRKRNVGRLEVSACADLCNVNWHDLIDFAER